MSHKQTNTLRIKRLGVLYEALSNSAACKKATEMLQGELALASATDRPLRLDILPVKIDSLGEIEDASIIPLSHGVNRNFADAYVVRAVYGNHYVALHSALSYDVAYVAAIYLSLKTGLLYEGIFNVK